MAGKNSLSKPTYRFLIENPVISDSISVEFDESDIWDSHPLPIQTRFESKKSVSGSRILKKPVKRTDLGDREVATAASSLPLNIPDWSKILPEECRGCGRREIERGSDDDEEDSGIPPHEFLAKQFARSRISCYSLHEGIGRTLKGRDLRRVRNAIWEITGFED